MYQALYRKWRPKTFSDVVGQDHITSTLMNEISSGRHSHAYLFTGSRGTGKTTCAKIFAKAVNCEHPVNGDPCNECETCRGIDSGSVLDVIEIDAASNNGVDNIRDIRDEANFTPVSGKYRVYIIDEVHMLSTGAFNALLKTLEEPPEHVKFILATTEVHKLPATILSRCQRFDFKRISPEDITKRLLYIADKENLVLDEEAAMLIARLADGALRDALSILDQCIGHSKNVTADIVNETVGLAGKDYLFSLSKSILANDSASALTMINDLHNRSCDMERLCNELTNHFRNIMVCKAVKNPKDLIICAPSELEEYLSLAENYSMERILNVLNVLGDTLLSLRKGLNRRVEMEMAIVRLCSGAVPAVAVNEAVKPECPTPKAVNMPATVQSHPAPASVNNSREDIPVPTNTSPKQETTSLNSTREVTVSPGSPLPCGLIPTNIWNSLIREVVSTDKALIGTMNSAKGYKNGEALQILTDNVLLKKFITMEQHRDAIYNATFSILGEYLKPVLIEEEPEPMAKAPDITEKSDKSHPAEKPLEPSDKEEPGDIKKSELAEKSEEEKEKDPLDAFINNMNNISDSNQIDFSLFVEE